MRLSGETEVSEPLSSVERVVRVLDAFADRPRWRISDLARELELPKAGVHRIVHSLEVLGYLRQEEERGPYVLGGRAVALGRQALTRAAVARPHRHLMRLSEVTGAVALFYELRGHRYVCLERLDVNSLTPSTVEIGDTVGLHAGAGKAILAFQDPQFIDEVLRARLSRYSARTPSDPATIREMLKRIRLDGIWVSRSEITEGTVGISAPVVDENGNVSKCVCVSLPEKKASDELVERWATEVRQVALTISQESGGYSTTLTQGMA